MKNTKYNVIGIMSGTSCDGLDIAHCMFYNEDSEWKYELKKSKCINFPKKLKKRLLNCSKTDAFSLKVLDLDLGEFIKNELRNFIKKSETKFQLISCHGHTVFHDINKKIHLQIGNPFIIYNSIKIPVIYNFRELDVILGGQGAPLVPYGDKKLFKEYDYCINIGGILNISKLKEKKLLGYDICPANIVLNNFSRKTGYEFDIDGKVSLSGNFDDRLFKKLNKLSYYDNLNPKSLDINYIEKYYYPLMVGKEPKNILNTFIDHIAFQVNKNIDRKNTNILLTGGGAFNEHLIKKINQFNKLDNNFIVPNKKIVNFKEAVVFGFLGLLRYLGFKNLSKSVTGSKFSTSSGLIIENKLF